MNTTAIKDSPGLQSMNLLLENLNDLLIMLNFLLWIHTFMMVSPNNKRETFLTIVPQSASTCRNFGVFEYAQTKSVHSELQSGL